MALVLGSGRSDSPNSYKLQGHENPNVVRKSANYHPSIWADCFVNSSPEELKPDEQGQQRAKELKEEVKRMLRNVNDPLHEIKLIDAIQRLGVAYHFDTEIADALLRMYNIDNDGKDDSDDLNVVALRFRLLRQEGHNVSPSVFQQFKDDEGNFKKSFASDINGLLSLYEAAHLRIRGEDILDEAIVFTKENLKLAFPHLTTPLSTLVELALELPLRRRVERLQSRYYISIYQEEKGRNDNVLEFAKLDFNLLQSLHRRELKEISMWWKGWDFSVKLPFIRDRVVECYFWVLGVYFEPQYSRARMITSRIISLISIMDDIYDVYGTLEELQLFTDVIQRWDRNAIDQLPDFMQLHFRAILDAVDKFEEELAQEGKSYRISYLKEALQEISKYYFIEIQWFNSGYEPTMEEYMKVAMITGGYHALSVVSYVGMGDIATKEAFEWIISKTKLTKAASVVCRLKDDIQSNQLEQERGHVASSIQVYMKEHGCSYEEACEKFRGMVADAWKDINKECMKPTAVPMALLMRTVNLARVIEMLYQHRDGYTNSTHETKDHISLVLVNPIPI